MKLPMMLSFGLIFLLGSLVYIDYGRTSTMPEKESEPVIQEETTEEEVFCIQVVTPARNVETGAFQEFPTPCDVPHGWEIIEPELFDLNFEVL